MKDFNAQDAALFLLALAEVPQVMSAFLPSPFTAATFGGTPKAHWLRRGEVVGSLVSVGIAGSIALVTKRWAPLAGGLLVLGVFLWEYEKALKAGEQENDGARDMRDF